MSYNGSGTFQANSTGLPVVTATTISSTMFNAMTADLATGLSTAICKDGQTATTARIPFASGLSTAAANPFVMTNAQAITVALTAQTSGAATLTIPDFAGVSDEFTFKTKSQTMSNKTLASPTISGHATIEGITATGATGTGKFVFDTAPTFSTTGSVGGTSSLGVWTIVGDNATNGALAGQLMVIGGAGGGTNERLVLGYNTTSDNGFIQAVHNAVANTPLLLNAAGGNVGIGTSPATSAALEVASTTGAILIPRMTTTQKNALTAVDGMIVYDSTLAKFYGREAGAWNTFSVL